MTRAETIDSLKSRLDELSDEELAALDQLAAHLAAPPFHDSAPADALASIARGLDQRARGETQPASAVFYRLQAKIDAARR